MLTVSEERDDGFMLEIYTAEVNFRGKGKGFNMQVKS